MEEDVPRIERLFQELSRQAFHIAVILFSIPLRWLGFRYALCFSFIALLWNIFGMPRFFSFSLRRDEKAKGFSSGMISYPLTIAISSIIFPIPVLAGVWAVLSLADGVATVSGVLYGRAKIFYNRKKSWTGFLAYWLVGSVGFFAFYLWAQPNFSGSIFEWQRIFCSSVSFSELLVICVLSNLVSAIVESLPINFLNDNLTAPLACGVSFVLMASLC